MPPKYTLLLFSWAALSVALGHASAFAEEDATHRKLAVTFTHDVYSAEEGVKLPSDDPEEGEVSHTPRHTLAVR